MDHGDILVLEGVPRFVFWARCHIFNVNQRPSWSIRPIIQLSPAGLTSRGCRGRAEAVFGYENYLVI
jgi:hypothetical protein